MYSETLELSWNIEPNRIQSNQIEFFQYLDVFSSYSFNYTGICFQDNLHSSLKHIIDENKPISTNYVFDQ
jgi:hypothetical protein